jgi:pSer/pThr/pTyr-binding forkhead associated (FHA) protein
MVDQLLLLLQALFLLVLFLFIWWVMRTARRDLRLPQESFFIRPTQADGRAVTPTAHVVIERSPSLEAGASFALGTVPVTIGRSGENAIALSADEFASGHHARIEPLRDGLWIVDLGSTNGTYVNGEPVAGRERLAEGDLVRVGETELRVGR